MSHRYYKGFKQQVTFNITQCHSQSFHSIGIYNFLFVFHCNYVTSLHHFRDIIAYFFKLKDVT